MKSQGNPFVNPFRQALAQNRPLTGVWSMLNSTNAVEGLGWAGFDWILIDGEHSPVSLGDAANHLRALGATPTVPIIRVACNDPTLLKQVLDIGARTIMVPFVQSPADAHAAVSATRYPPAGQRGFAAMHRASRFGHIADYVHHADAGIFLIVQAETQSAIAQVEGIAAVDGVDAVFFGPGDLSASMGLLGQPASDAVTEAIETAAKQVRSAGKAVGVLAPNQDLAVHYIRAGFDFVSVATDCGLLFGQADRLAADFRAIAGERA